MRRVRFRRELQGPARIRVRGLRAVVFVRGDGGADDGATVNRERLVEGAVAQARSKGHLELRNNYTDDPDAKAHGLMLCATCTECGAHLDAGVSTLTNEPYIDGTAIEFTCEEHSALRVLFVLEDA